jgi:alcohol dehydrogenase
MIDQFYFQLKTQTYYGFGYSRSLGQFLTERNFKNVAILVHEGVYSHSSYYKEIRRLIEDHVDTLIEEVLRGDEEPDYDYLDEITKKVRDMPDLDVLIGIGGGSCLDIVKAAAALRNNPGRGIEYRGFDKVKNPSIPVIAIPTTAGTGSEVTVNAVFTSKQEKKKLGINGHYMNAAYAILDAEWTLSCPPSVSISSGLDALVHSMESFMTNKSNPLTRIYSKQGFKLLYEALPTLVDDPVNKDMRQQLLLGSYLAAISLFNSGSGVAGAMSYPVGVHFKVPHGIGGALFLPDVIELNINKGFYDYSEIYDLIEPGVNSSTEKKSLGFLEKLRQLYDKLGVDPYLDRWGITQANVEEVGILMHPLQAAFDQNPVACSAQEDALNILKKHVRP